MILSPFQIAELLKIIDQYHLLFLAGQFGTDILSPQDLQTLADAGIDATTFPQLGSIDYAFHFGILSYALKQSKAKELDYRKFKQYVQSKGFVPLTNEEQAVLQSIKTQALGDIKGLGQRIGNQVQTKAAALNRQQTEQILRDAATKAVEARKGAKFMASEIGHATQEWGRDFDRISSFILHKAWDEGRAVAITKDHGKDALVYKDVYAGGCKHCIRLHLTAGLDSQPIIFKLSELVANGSNIGRKVDDWKAVLGPTHPYCRCTLHFVGPNMVWDAKTKTFNPNAQYVRKVQRKSTVGVTIDGVTTVI